MESRISATQLARRLGDVLGRIRYRGERFVIERNGAPVARLEPLTAAQASKTVAEALTAWRSAAPADPEFAADLEAVEAADHPPASPWDS